MSQMKWLASYLHCLDYCINFGIGSSVASIPVAASIEVATYRGLDLLELILTVSLLHS